MRSRTTLVRRLAAVAGVVACGGVVAATAWAVPVREGTISASSPVYSWDGGPGNGSGQGVSYVRCTPAVYECEDTLVELKDAGDLVAEIKAGEGANDLDVAIYKSDDAGTTAGDPVNGDQPDAEDTSTNANSKATLKKAQPGFYVVRVRTFDGIQATWEGSATLKLPPPPVPPQPATPSPTPAPTAKPPAKTKKKKSAKKRRAACRKKAKKIKSKSKRKRAMKRCKRIR